MIVVSAGMQKAGSGLFFNLTNDLLVAAGMQDVRQLKSKFGLKNILKHYNCNIGDLHRGNFEQIIPLHEAGNSFAVKTHRGPTKFVKMLMKKGVVKTTLIYRDPRDVVLSAMDHGEKIRKDGENHSFAPCTSTAETIPYVKLWLDTGIMGWLESDRVLKVKYENLIATPAAELKRLGRFLDIDLSSIDLKALYGKYKGSELDDLRKQYLHYNVGQAGRFRTIMSARDLTLCNRHFSKYLKKLQYPES